MTNLDARLENAHRNLALAKAETSAAGTTASVVRAMNRQTYWARVIDNLEHAL